jgi:uncharacterized membrane protein YeaQ/YmgE (transglycosylase-associated protein family)
MELIAFLISLAFTGLIVGALGRLLLPGRDPMSIPMTIGVGMLSTLVTGLVLSALIGRNAGSLALSVVVAVGIVYLIRRSRQGRAAHTAARARPSSAGAARATSSATPRPPRPLHAAP